MCVVMQHIIKNITPVSPVEKHSVTIKKRRALNVEALYSPWEEIFMRQSKQQKSNGKLLLFFTSMELHFIPVGVVDLATVQPV